jgi:membrane protein DedA with SNARE-associated domain
MNFRRRLGIYFGFGAEPDEAPPASRADLAAVFARAVVLAVLAWAFGAWLHVDSLVLRLVLAVAVFAVAETVIVRWRGRHARSGDD